MGKNNKNDAENTNEQQLFLETKNRKIRSNGQLSTPRAEEGYCKEATQSRPSTHRSAKPKICPKIEVKTKNVLDKGRNTRSYMELHVLQKVSHRHLWESVWNMETTKSRLWDVHGCKETHKPEKLYHGEKKITEMEIEEIKKELQENQRSHTGESEGKQL